MRMTENTATPKEIMPPEMMKAAEAFLKTVMVESDKRGAIALYEAVNGAGMMWQHLTQTLLAAIVSNEGADERAKEVALSIAENLELVAEGLRNGETMARVAEMLEEADDELQG